MPDLICDTSPIQYLHQLGLLDILHVLAGRVIVPPTVVSELAEGQALGINLPDLHVLDWIEIRRPVSALAVPLVTDLGPGERQVLMLGLEWREAVVVLGKALARPDWVKQVLDKVRTEGLMEVYDRALTAWRQAFARLDMHARRVWPDNSLVAEGEA